MFSIAAAFIGPDIIQPHRTEEEYNKIEERDEYERGMSYVPSKDYTTFDDYFRRLEDICVNSECDHIVLLQHTLGNTSAYTSGISRLCFQHTILSGSV